MPTCRYVEGRTIYLLSNGFPGAGGVWIRGHCGNRGGERYSITGIAAGYRQNIELDTIALMQCRKCQCRQI